jgi:hypothetical protein
VRIPDYQQVRSNWDEARLVNGPPTVGEHLDQIRAEFVEEHKRRFMGTDAAMEFVQERLPYLPVAEQAAVARQLLEDTDRTVRWSSDPSRARMSPETERQRRANVSKRLAELVESARTETLGVADLARSLDLKLATPEGVPQDGFAQIGTHWVSTSEVPATSLHHRTTDGERTSRGEVKREGSELAFTGWVPRRDGYLQLHARIDAETNEGPLTAREKGAIEELSNALGRAYGELIPTRNLGSVGSTHTGDGVLGRPFDQRRALADGTYVYAPAGEGAVHHWFDASSRGHSGFSIGPASFSVMHGTKHAAFGYALANGRSYQVHSSPGQHVLSMQIPLASGDTALATLPPQPTRDAAEAQLISLIELARAVFGG